MERQDAYERVEEFVCEVGGYELGDVKGNEFIIEDLGYDERECDDVRDRIEQEFNVIVDIYDKDLTLGQLVDRVITELG